MVAMVMKSTLINKIIDVEGGYVNDPDDSGGETNYGITVAVARAHGYTGSMRDMPKDMAYRIYSAIYWDAVQGDELFKLSEDIAAEVVDTAINCGSDRAARILQRSLNVLNDRGNHYPDIPVDGNIGKITVATLYLYLQKRDGDVLLKMLNVLQGAHYVELAERREKDERFIYGWFKNRVNI